MAAEHVLRRIVLAYLFAALLLRFALLVGRILLSPQAVGYHDPEALRVIPMSNAEARFWHRRLVLFIGWFAFGWATVELVRTLGFSSDGRRLVAYVLGFGLLAIAVEAVWKWPASLPVGPEVSNRPHHNVFGMWLLSLYLVLLWGGMMVGRFAGSFLLRRFVPSRVLAGFAIFGAVGVAATLWAEKGKLFTHPGDSPQLDAGAAHF